MSATVSPSPSGSKPPAATPAALGPAPAIDDMQDTPADLARWPGLAGMLQACAQVVEPAFRQSDQAALKHQWNHRQLAKWAIVFGTTAVILAILQLAFVKVGRLERMSVPECISVVLAVAAVGLGLRAAFQTNWLVERNKAERLRLAKFRFLIDPDLWSGGPAVQGRKRTELEQQVREIVASGFSAVHHWVENDTVPHPPPAVLALTVPPPSSDELLDYYRTRRLQYQLGFFRKRANQNLKLDKFTKYLSPFLFFGSVGAVLIHFGYDFATGAKILDPFSRWMIVLAASLPALGGMIRTIRTAYEFARNTYRYRAKAVALTSIDSGLEHATDPRTQFLGLWLSEQTLENEHREWLRLMLEAEWFA